MKNPTQNKKKMKYINYENHICPSLNKASKKNLGGGNSKKKYTNINQKKEKEKSPMQL